MSLIKHSSWNIVGYLIPSLIAIPSMGIISRKLGMESFGLFTLLFALVGYASIFDVGISRAVTRLIAINQHDKQDHNIICSTASLFILLFSGMGAVIVFFLSDQIAYWLNVTPDLYSTTVVSLKIMSISIPLFLLTQIWLGILEGLELFSIINIQRIITSSLISILPLGLIYIENTLSYAVFGLVSARLITCIIVWLITRSFFSIEFSYFRKKILSDLLRFGGWLTVSNIISPLMVYFDRFLLSNLSGAQSVAQYTAPSELVSRLGVFPGAIAKALFPKLTQNSDSYKQGVMLLTLSSFIIIFPFFIFAEEILTLWLGNDYQGIPTLILKILLIGFFFNSIAQAPFSAIQAKGRAKITAYIHLLELFPYLLLLFIMIHYYGVIGVAIAWTCRVLLDSIILFLINNRIDKYP